MRHAASGWFSEIRGCMPHMVHELQHLLGKGEEEREQKDDIAHLNDLVCSIFYVTSQGGYNRVGKVSDPECCDPEVILQAALNPVNQYC
jgi:hypothetical protein